MRGLIYFLIFSGLIGAGFVTVALAPYHLYETALEDGIESEFLAMKKPRKGLLAPMPEDWDLDENYSEKEKLWQSFHFADYVIPMPIHHPLFMVIPEIEQENQYSKLNFGATFKGFDQRDYVYFRTSKVQNFKIDLGNQKIFNLPIFKKMILDKTDEEVWKDMLTLSTELPKNEDGFFQRWNTTWDIPYSDLVYRLFIIQMRHQVFPENVQTFSYDEETQKAILEIYEFGIDDTKLIKEGLDPEYRNEIVMFFEKRQLYQVKLRTLYDDRSAKFYRKKFVKNLEFKLSTNDSIIPIYARYKRLSYNRRIDQEGMVYLFSSWTHLPESSDFLEEMIRFLERGKSRYEQLSPLYQFAYDHFGTNFSTRSENLRETENEKMKRIMREQKVEDDRQEKERELSSEEIIPEGQERIEFFLQKAKDSGHSEKNNKKILLEN